MSSISTLDVWTQIPVDFLEFKQFLTPQQTPWEVKHVCLRLWPLLETDRNHTVKRSQTSQKLVEVLLHMWKGWSCLYTKGSVGGIGIKMHVEVRHFIKSLGKFIVMCLWFKFDVQTVTFCNLTPVMGKLQLNLRWMPDQTKTIGFMWQLQMYPNHISRMTHKTLWQEQLSNSRRHEKETGDHQGRGKRKRMLSATPSSHLARPSNPFTGARNYVCSLYCSAHLL